MQTKNPQREQEDKQQAQQPKKSKQVVEQSKQSQMIQQSNRNVVSLTLEDLIETEQIIQKQNKPKGSLKRCNLIQGCELIQNYQRLNKIHQGNYGVVYRALELPTGTIHAIKKLKIIQGSDFPITSLREIAILRNIDHPNIMKITRVAGSPSKDKVYIVMQYLDHQVKQLLKHVNFTEPQIRRLMQDLLRGISHLHERKIVHRDLKTSNLLYSNEGILKICDFGLARKASQALMTQQVITMWYRPPELLLGEYNYSTELDIWSVGCIMAELCTGQTPFRGKTELEQLDLIFRTVGAPNEENWPDIKTFKNYMYVAGKRNSVNRLSEFIQTDRLGIEGKNILKLLLTANPRQRISAKKALNHPWFKGEICSRENMPRHTPINQFDRVKKRVKISEDGPTK